MKWLLLAASIVLAACAATPAATSVPTGTPIAVATPTATPPTVPSSAPSASPAPSGCVNPPPDLASIAALDPPTQLACFGDAKLTFQATIGKAIFDCGIGPRIAPSWFCLPGIFLTSPNAAVATSLLAAYWDPASGLKPSSFTFGKVVQVTGQFDAPQAQTCHVVEQQAGQPTESTANAILGCRQEFVISSVK